jgi:hypothetical protein
MSEPPFRVAIRHVSILLLETNVDEDYNDDAIFKDATNQLEDSDDKIETMRKNQFNRSQGIFHTERSISTNQSQQPLTKTKRSWRPRGAR